MSGLSDEYFATFWKAAIQKKEPAQMGLSFQSKGFVSPDIYFVTSVFF